MVPNERDINVGTAWNCSNTKQFTYAGGGARLSHSVTTPPGHPFARKIWAGSCEEGQLTAGGFHDSRMHGKVELLPSLLTIRSNVSARTFGSCTTLALAFYTQFTLTRLMYARRSLLARNMWPVACLRVWTPLFLNASGPFIRNRRGKVSVASL